MSEDLLAFERQMLGRVDPHQARARVRLSIPTGLATEFKVLRLAWVIWHKTGMPPTPPRWFYLTDAYVDALRLPAVEFELGRSHHFLTQAGRSLRVGVELDGHPYLPFPGGSYVHVALARWHGLI